MDEKRFSLNDILEALNGTIEDGIKDGLRETEKILRRGCDSKDSLRELEDVMTALYVIKELRNYLPKKLGFEFIQETRDIGEEVFEAESKWVYKGDTQG